jgi:hypothetical protein
MMLVKLGPIISLAYAMLACAGPAPDGAPDLEAGPNARAMAPAVSSDGDDDGSESVYNGAGPQFGLAAESPPESDGLEPEEVCAGIVHEGERLPLDMYFLVDLSGSMAEPAGTGSKWQLVSQALTAFLSEPRNADIGVGIGFFPLGVPPTCVAGDEGCVCIPFVNICAPVLGGSCTVSDYSAPAVALSLPPNPAAVVRDIATRQVAGGTPTRPALEGALQYLESWASANPGRKSVVILATDGDPTGCLPNAPQDVASLAAAALNGDSKIQTFVIGVGRSLTSLNLVARAGGTTQAFLTDTSGDLVQELADALSRIRTRAGPCAFELPGLASGQTLDPNLVNVRFVPPGAATATVVARTYDGRRSSCGADGGWHYDDPAAPSRIELCEATCDALLGARLEVELGCSPIVAQPR